MIARFCAYAVLRNLRFFEPFFLLFLLHDVGVDFVAAGALLAYEKLLGGALEVPLGVVTDRLGRRRALIASFSLAAAAFAVFAWAAHTRAWTLPLLYLGQTLYAVAEAARSGSHKAIILDWLTQQGRRGEKTRVIGTTRFFSKASGGAAALIAGSIVWGTGHFTALFWAAMVPTLGAAALLWTYPRSVEGSLSQRPPESPEGPGLWAGLAQAAKRPGLLGLVAASVLFESESKLALVYLQPYLAARLAAVELPVAAGVGAVIYGAWFFIQGLLAGSASLL
ncbi:MAG: MFS transporter, partial [Myxococcales bacterium]|nr:MFS transporter [Myxococcales bacterium]